MVHVHCSTQYTSALNCVCVCGITDTASAVQETPVQSAISEPSSTTVIKADDEYITVKGYAFSGGGRGIFRVDLSLDGGKTWINPELDNNGG